MRLLIAGLVTELEPRYENTKRLAEPFRYEGNRPTDIRLTVTDDYLKSLMRRAAPESTVEQMENFAFCCDFNRKAIPFQTMLVHSSALVYDGGAYLFSADSGVGKSTHTRLWLQAFGDRVHILNDDKPVVRLSGSTALCCGTPFDGGSGIAHNETVPLRAIVFVERGKQNAVRIPTSREVLQKIYFQTAHMVSAQTADRMLANFERLLAMSEFYVLTCTADVSAAHTAFDGIINHIGVKTQ